MFVLLGISFSVWPWLALKYYAKATKLSREVSYLPNAPILWAASLIFISSFFLPDIHISAETNTFQQHFIGGGFVCALLAFYVESMLKLKLHFINRFLLVTAISCSLGVINELMEFTITETTTVSINSSDTWWDLLANTTGSYVGYATIIVICLLRSSRRLKERSNH